jgi:hypothetical protein
MSEFGGVAQLTEAKTDPQANAHVSNAKMTCARCNNTPSLRSMRDEKERPCTELSRVKKQTPKCAIPLPQALIGPLFASDASQTAS